LQPDFWHDRWRSGQIGFHQTAVDRQLKEFWPRLGLPAHGRVFVPLCGKSLDLLWLHDRCESVVGVELSAVALESFCLQHGIAARRRLLGDFDAYEADGLSLLRGDFFAMTKQLLGEFSAVYDRAALISWTPALQPRYVEHMTELTSPGTRTLLITLEYRQDEMNGPPFSVSADDVERLYAKHHEIVPLDRQDILASEARLRSRGVKQLHAVCYLLTRR
jgi:thiopurine S-methyltransferase